MISAASSASHFIAEIGGVRSMLRRLSIKTRILVVTAILIAILAGTTLYTTAMLAANSRAVAHTAELAELTELANQIRSTFGEYRYWLTDLAASLLRLSETNANAARERLSQKLDLLARSRPDVAATIRTEVAEFESDAKRAVEEYTNDQRVVGNTFLAAARQHSIAIDARLTTFVDGLSREAAAERSRVQSDVARTTFVAAVIVGLTILLGILAALIVLSSISKPLDKVVAAMAGITAGDLNVEIPQPAPDEIGAMARTLRIISRQHSRTGKIVGTERRAEASDSDRHRDNLRWLRTLRSRGSDGFVQQQISRALPEARRHNPTRALGFRSFSRSG